MTIYSHTGWDWKQAWQSEEGCWLWGNEVFKLIMIKKNLQIYFFSSSFPSVLRGGAQSTVWVSDHCWRWGPWCVQFSWHSTVWTESPVKRLRARFTSACSSLGSVSPRRRLAVCSGLHKRGRQTRATSQEWGVRGDSGLSGLGEFAMYKKHISKKRKQHT